MNPGFWHSNFYPTNFWHEDFWQDFGGLTTNALHIFSTANIDNNFISDSGNNVLIAGDTETHGDIYTKDVYFPESNMAVFGDNGEAAIWFDLADNVLFVSCNEGIEIEANDAIFIDAPNTKIGSVTNYIDIDSDGIQTFVGSSAINGLKTNATADKTSDYQVLITDDNVSIDATSNAVTVTLESAPEDGRVIKIACSNDTFTADIDFNGNTFYGGSGNEEIFKQEILVFQFNGTEWRLG